MILAWIIVVMLLSMGIFFVYFGIKDEVFPAIICGLILTGASLMIYVFTDNTTVKENPTAIDVYRGKTTLQITYRDNIPVDTIVVFKNK